MFEGTLEDGELLPTLRWIAALRQGGLLSVQGEPDLVSVTFDGGAIVAADAMNRPAEEMLGEVLARRGLLDPADYSAAVEPFMGTGRLASEVLAERGLVDRDELLEAVREQTYSQVVRLLRWDSGNFNWTPKVESPFEVGMRSISVAELLLRASEDLGVEGPLRGRPPGLDEVYQAEDAPPDATVQVIGRDGDWEPGASDAHWITPSEERLLSLLRRRPGSGARLAAETDLDPLEVRYGLYELRRAGLVRRVEVVSEPEAGRHDEPGVDVESPVLGSDHGEPAPGWSAAPLLESPERELEAAPAPWPGARFEEPSAAPRAQEVEAPIISDYEPWKVAVAEEEAEAAESYSERRGRRPRRRGVVLQRTATWLARGLGVAVALVVSTLLVWHDQRSSLLFPFPWQREERLAFERSQGTALYDKIDRAVRSYYLLYGRYPEELGILVDLELLRSSELFDARGRWLQYDVADGGYTLRPVESGLPVSASGIRAELRSDFFLNPKFVELPQPSRNPVVLLD